MAGKVYDDFCTYIVLSLLYNKNRLLGAAADAAERAGI
jgi:hypothetical protein